jgi:TolB-like protein/Tfp pilus assembly protein PilF
MQQIWEEIRRRNLHRVTAAYAVIGWVLVQGAAIVFPAFELPGWTLRLLIVLLVVALPILWAALWLSHPSVARADAAPARLHHTEWVLIGLLALVLIASAGEFAYSQFKGAAGTAGAPAERGQRDASIAVLAFDNMSSDRNNEYFSDGVSEELLNDLAQVPGLRVAARTSSFSFKGKHAEIGEIGKALHVRTVLEGSVRRQGNHVRITAQLIDASDDYHIWSQTYDRDLSDIFAVQDEISRAITRELIGHLLGTAPATARRHQVVPEAYTAYLKGRFFLNKRNRDAMANAVVLFKQAIALDPAYAEAHASLALAYVVLMANGGQRDALSEARDEAATALRLDPELFDAMLADAEIQETSWNWSKAYGGYSQLLARYPKSADAHHFYGYVMMNLYLPERWLEEHRQAAALDPLSALDQENVGEALHALGRNDEAIVEYQKALTLDPDLVFTLAQLCVSYAERGSVDEARKILDDRLTAVDGEGNHTTRCRTAIAGRDPDPKKALRALAQNAERANQAGKVNESLVGLIYAQAGDFGTALEWFRKAIAAHDPRFFQNTIGTLLPAALTADPRWKALLGGTELREWGQVRAAVSSNTAEK